MADNLLNLPIAEDDVIVYGGDHSPWVQAVLLGLHLKGIRYRVYSFPPWRVFSFSGILMPAARLADGSWMLQSQDILEAYGYGRLDRDEFRAILRILRGGVHRVDSISRFWNLWSRVRDDHTNRLMRLRNFLLRPFQVLYYQVALSRLGVTPATSPTPEQMKDNYAVWQEKVLSSPGLFMDGESPGLRDIYVFAAIQLHASMPVPSLEVLRCAPELEALRSWVLVMQARCGDYRHLYSAPYFDPGAVAPDAASMSERCAFWLGGVLLVLTAPLAEPLMWYKRRSLKNRGLIMGSARF